MLHKGIAFESRPVNLLAGEHLTSEFLAKNPSGFVPAIEINNQVFGESLAILEWIEETYPQNPLLPSSPTDRLLVRQICLMIASGIQPIQNLSVLRKLSSDPEVQASWAKHWIEVGLTKVEKIVSRHGGTYCLGGQLTFADLCVVPQMYNARRFNVDVRKFPTLMRIDANCRQLTNCHAASPDEQQK
jgi:maleylacetoacetate isomerase